MGRCNDSIRRRMGWLSISSEDFYDYETGWLIVSELRLVIDRAEYDGYTNCINVRGQSPRFDKVKNGELIPKYDALLYRDAAGVVTIPDVVRVPCCKSCGSDG